MNPTCQPLFACEQVAQHSVGVSIILTLWFNIPDTAIVSDTSDVPQADIDEISASMFAQGRSCTDHSSTQGVLLKWTVDKLSLSVQIHQRQGIQGFYSRDVYYGFWSIPRRSK